MRSRYARRSVGAARDDGVDLDEHLACADDHDFSMGFAGGLQAPVQLLDSGVPAEAAARVAA